MMNVRHVWMFMGDGIVPMKMRMRLGYWARVRVPMVFVVKMRVVVLYLLVDMKMAVLFPNHQIDTGHHRDHSKRLPGCR